MRRKTTYIEVTETDMNILQHDIFDDPFSRIVLVANTRKTIIRVADIPPPAPDAAAKWELVRQNFPLGSKMNERTYVFDGSMFSSEGNSRFFMAALPMHTADVIARLAPSIHRIKRLETIEHILFRHYAPTTLDSFCLALLQGDGLRILHMAHGLPCGAYSISNISPLREAEAERTWRSLHTPPSRVVFLRNNRPPDANCWDWFLAFAAQKGAITEAEDYSLQKLTFF